MLTSHVHLPGASLASVGLGGLLYFLAARRQVVMRIVLFTWVPSWMRKGAAAQLDVFLKWFLELFHNYAFVYQVPEVLPCFAFLPSLCGTHCAIFHRAH